MTRFLKVALLAGFGMLSPAFAEDTHEPSAKPQADTAPAKAAPMDSHCVPGDGKGCAICPDVSKLPKKAPPGRVRTDKDACNTTNPYCGDDGKLYTYMVHFVAAGSLNGRPMISIPNLTDDKGERVCPENYVYRVYQAKR